MATTAHNLNFRATPGGEIVRTLPFGVTLTALERTDNWFRVDYHGTRGWVSADYVIAHDNCG